MANIINISEYQRNGIYIEERNNSILDPVIQSAQNVHFVPGYTRRATVYNKPMLLTRRSDRKRLFGDIDKSLERKGSFFHRTIDVVMQTAPTYGMALLKTEDTPDYKVDYISLSTSAQYSNKEVDIRQYDDYFNKTGFWNKDTESFLFFANDDEQMLHITNLSDSKVTVFVIKNTNPAFDMTVEDWYNYKKEDMPTWLHPKALISDYLIRVAVVKGDYTNYSALSVDPIYSKFFSNKGLRKGMLTNFLNDRNVTQIADYHGSIIPYFRDMENKLMYIESMINNESDQTGLLCAVDIDKIEKDYSTGVVDFIGDTLAYTNGEAESINFLSYQEKIREFIGYSETNKDYSITDDILMAFDITYNASSDITFNDINNDGIYGKVLRSNGYEDVVLGNSITAPTHPFSGMADGDYVVHITNDNLIEISKTTSKYNGIPVMWFNISTGTDSLTGTIDGNAFTSITTFYNYVITPNDNSVNPVGQSYLITYDSTLIDDEYQLNFYMTSNNPPTSNVEEIFAKYMMDFVGNMINRYSYVDTAGIKYYLDPRNMTKDYSFGYGYINITTNDTVFNNGSNATNIIFTDKHINRLDNSSPTNGFMSNIIAPYINPIDLLSHEPIGLDSKLIQDYLNGNINTGDFFYLSLGEITTFIDFYKYVGAGNGTTVEPGDNYVVFDDNTLSLSFNTGDKIKFADESNFYTILEVVNPVDIAPLSGSNDIFDSGNYDYNDSSNPNLQILKVAEDIKPNKASKQNVEILNANDNDGKIYMKMFTISNDEVHIDFYNDDAFTAIADVSTHKTGIFYVNSGRQDFTETIEIELHNDFDMTDNQFLIDQSRYGGVKVGDYIRAEEIDPNDLEPGEMPRMFTRIIRKTSWTGNVANNVNYAVITTDAKYYYTDANHGGGIPDLQTYKYKSIEEYVDTYKGFKLGGFRIKESMNPYAPYNNINPENAQKEILSVIEKDSPLYCALTDKQNFSFRYLIDSFGNGLTEFSKQELGDITGKRKNALAFLNTPSAKMFKQSSSPSYINVDGTLNMDYVRKGANDALNPPFLYSFLDGSGKDDGRDTVMYSFPWVIVNDNGRPLTFPPAAYVANTYMRKNDSPIEGKHNFTVAAGVMDGRIQGIAGTEMQVFTEQDLINADLMGLNLILYHNTYGYYLNAEYTASVTPKSALSNVHVRELLIDMENEMYDMLFKYQFQFNIPSVRAKVKREADDICQKYMNKGGIVYYENVIDETNNTADLIDNQFGLLETTIVPVSAMAKIVNIFNITSNGALAGSTGFGNAA